MEPQARSGKSLRYLRVSITDRCNFRCAYCMPPEGIRKISHSDILRHHEMLSVIRLLVDRFAVRKVRVTGGEPLVRRGVCEFLAELCRIPSLDDISVTTNGYFLEGMAAAIRAAGVARINISIDTFRRDLFRAITRVDGLDQTLRGIDAALAYGFSPVKLNVVVLESNLDEVLDFVAYGKEKGVEVRFIERMPGWSGESAHIPNGEVKRRIERKHLLSPVHVGGGAVCDEPDPGDGGNGGEAAVRYFVDGGPTICGFISPISEPFCSGCERIRLRGDGRLVPCLMSPAVHDLMPYVRPVLRADDLIETIRKALSLSDSKRPAAAAVPLMPQVGG